MSIKKLVIITIEILIVVLLFENRHLLSFHDVDEVLAFIESFGYLSVFVYIAFCLVASLFFTPLAVMRVIAMVLFGPILGTLAALGGIILGSAACFFLSRYVFASYFLEKFGEHKLYAKINGAVKKRKGLVMIGTRFNPVFSNSLQNYLYGLTEISFRDYITWSSILYTPATVLIALWAQLAAMDNIFTRENLPMLLFLVVFILLLTSLIFYLKKRSNDLVDGD